jgi:hypothetical protein
VADARGGEWLGIQRAAEERQGRVGVGWNVAGRGRAGVAGAWRAGAWVAGAWGVGSGAQKSGESEEE